MYSRFSDFPIFLYLLTSEVAYFFIKPQLTISSHVFSSLKFMAKGFGDLPIGNISNGTKHRRV